MYAILAMLEFKQKAIKMLYEGNRDRAVGRIMGINKSTVYNWVKKAEEKIEQIITRSEGIEIISGEATINQFRKNGKILDAEISHTEDIVVELPYIYYIGYNVYINGEKTKNSESEKGFIEIAICKNDNAISKIETKYTGTISMEISCLLSISGIIILAVYIIKKEKYENIDIANNEEIVETQEK